MAISMGKKQNYPIAYRIMIFAPFADKNKIPLETMAINEKELTKDRKSKMKVKNVVAVKSSAVRTGVRKSQPVRAVNCTKNHPCERAFKNVFLLRDEGDSNLMNVHYLL
jgi:hypothetical protein